MGAWPARAQLRGDLPRDALAAAQQVAVAVVGAAVCAGSAVLLARLRYVQRRHCAVAMLPHLIARPAARTATRPTWRSAARITSILAPCIQERP